MSKKYIWFLVIGIAILIIPTAIYLGFLIPKIKEEYIVLMSSGGIISTGGYYGASKIPQGKKMSSVFRFVVNSFTTMIVFTLVQDFFNEIIGLITVFIVCFVIFYILKERYKDGKQKYRDKQLAKEITRSITENS